MRLNPPYLTLKQPEERSCRAAGEKDFGKDIFIVGN